jgi:hypothetical protein
MDSVAEVVTVSLSLSRSCLSRYTIVGKFEMLMHNSRAILQVSSWDRISAVQ